VLGFLISLSLTSPALRARRALFGLPVRARHCNILLGASPLKRGKKERVSVILSSVLRLPLSFFHFLIGEGAGGEVLSVRTSF